MSDKGREDYRQIIESAAASLAEEEYWVIEHPDGPLPETASKVFTNPILIICDATEMDWDDLCEHGFRLGRGTFPYEQTADAIIEASKSDG